MELSNAVSLNRGENALYSGEAQAAGKDAVTEVPTDVDFSCVVSEAGEVQWKMGVTSFEKLAAGLPAGSAYVKVEVLPQNGEKYPYLHPNGAWKLFIIGEIPDWFTETHEKKAMEAFEAWKAKAYRFVDLKILLNMTDPKDVAAGAPEEADIENLVRWANVYRYLTGAPRNSVRDTIAEAVGSSICNDAWNSVFGRVSVRNLKHAAGSAEKRISLIAAMIGSAFPGITQWKYYVGTEKGYPFQAGAALAKRGYLVSCAREWNLHAAAANELVYTLPPTALSSGKAFACVVDAGGSVYYRVGVDYCSDLIQYYGLDGTRTVQVNVTPKRYFQAGGETEVTILNAEIPSWYGPAAEAAVMAAYEAWHETVLARIHCKRLLTCLTEESVFGTHAALTDEIMEAMKTWAAVWNKANDAGDVIHSAVTEAGWKAVGATVWSEMHDLALEHYKLRHKGCPGPTTCGVVEAYIGEKLSSAVDEFMGNTIQDSYAAMIGSFVKGICLDENGNYLYQAGADLWNRGCIPMYDGTTWYLLSGPDGDVQVIYAGTNEELLADCVFAS